MPFLKQVLVRLLVYWAPSGLRYVVRLLIACLFAEVATWCRRTLLRFVAFFAALDTAFRSVDLRGTFLRDVAILLTFEAFGRPYDFSYSYVRPIYPHRLLLEELLGCLRW